MFINQLILIQEKIKDTMIPICKTIFFFLSNIIGIYFITFFSLWYIHLILVNENVYDEVKNTI